MTPLLNAIYFFLAAMVFLPVVELTLLAARRTRALRAYGAARGSFALPVVYREERVGLLGQPILRYLSMPTLDDVRRALARAPADAPLDVIVHLPRAVPFDIDGLVALLESHGGPVTLVVPVCVLTGGRRLVGCADRVLAGRRAAVADGAERAAPLAGGELPGALGPVLALYPQPPRRLTSPLFSSFDGSRTPPDTGERLEQA
ncbi:MAG TPA: hypothetical protein VK576_07420 [Thermoleophilia bacterium]|nr:hypothetical protein [Thermoleophilia bacterium]